MGRKNLYEAALSETIKNLKVLDQPPVVKQDDENDDVEDINP